MYMIYINMYLSIYLVCNNFCCCVCSLFLFSWIFGFFTIPIRIFFPSFFFFSFNFHSLCSLYVYYCMCYIYMLCMHGFFIFSSHFSLVFFSSSHSFIHLITILSKNIYANIICCVIRHSVEIFVVVVVEFICV